MPTKDRPKRLRSPPKAGSEKFGVAAAYKRSVAPPKKARGLAMRWELQLMDAVRSETKRLLGMHACRSQNFWDHLGRDSEKILASRRFELDEDVLLSKCLRFNHGVHTYNDALGLHGIWYTEPHFDGTRCHCYACANARSSPCSNILACRRFLAHLIDAKRPDAWDHHTFPEIPGDLEVVPRSLLPFTLNWNGTGTTMFDKGMRELFVAHFKRVTPRYKRTPSHVIDRIFATYANSLHRCYKRLQLPPPDTNSVGRAQDGELDESVRGEVDESEAEAEAAASSIQTTSFDDPDTIMDKATAPMHDTENVMCTIGNAHPAYAPVDAGAERSPSIIKRPSGHTSDLDRRAYTSARRLGLIEKEGLLDFFGAAGPDDIEACFSPDATSDDEAVENEDGTIEYLHRPLPYRAKVFTAVARMIDVEHAHARRDLPGRPVHKVNYTTLSSLPPRPCPLDKPSNWYNPEYIDELRQKDPLEASRLSRRMQPFLDVRFIELTRHFCSTRSQT